ncbi:MAG: hypothetical protein DMG13_16155 [Acidobacteria bacterium]|nr:MAG: hypothetical protein DMG13_16155 [Acidobacteriota bacterium]
MMLGDSPFVGLRPVLVVDARSEQACVPLVIDSLDEAIDPSKAQSFFDGIFIGYARLPYVLSEVDEPDFVLDLVILCEPRPPLLTIGSQYCFGHFHDYPRPVSIRWRALQ